MPKPLTDSEYLEQVRWNVECSRRYGIWFWPLAVASVFGFSWAADTLVKAIVNLVVNGGAVLDPTVIIGLIMGFMFGGKAAEYVMINKLPTNDRSLSLMLRCHDLLAENGWLADEPLRQNNRLGALAERLAQKKFLGLRILSLRPTDSEYVERMRKCEARSKRFEKLAKYFVSTLWLIVAGMACWLILMMGRNLGMPFFWGLAGGLIAGAVFCSVLIGAVHFYIHLLLPLKRSRTTELLVKYYDMLVEKI